MIRVRTIPVSSIEYRSIPAVSSGIEYRTIPWYRDAIPCAIGLWHMKQAAINFRAAKAVAAHVVVSTPVTTVQSAEVWIPVASPVDCWHLTLARSESVHHRNVRVFVIDALPPPVVRRANLASQPSMKISRAPSQETIVSNTTVLARNSLDH